MGSSNHRANADAQIAAPISKKCSSSSPSLYSTSAEIQSNMKAVTPLRRSTRICRQTPKAIGSSPESATEVSSISSRQKLYSSSRSQTYSDSTLCDITSSESSGSSTEDSVSYPANPTSRVAVFPPEVCETYDRLAPILRYSDAELGELVSLSPFPTTNPRPHSRMHHTGHSQFRCHSRPDKRAPAARQFDWVLPQVARVQQIPGAL